MGISFTEEQQAVIDARKCNILVSAAAGSGKTAVLVERIIQLMNEGTDIDHLLVVTFTRAAAAQMKEKITDAIHARLSEDPENVHFQRQETLIHNAQITTIDSFCQYVVKNNFNTIGLDPSYRVGDEGELKLLKEEVIGNLLEEEYERAGGDKNSDFLYCMDYFSRGSSDSYVEEYIGSLFDFSQSMPWPGDWLKDRALDYSLGEGSFDELDFVEVCKQKAFEKLKDAVSKLEQALSLSNEPDGPYMYADLLEYELDATEAVLKCSTYDEIFDALRNINYQRISGKKDPTVNADKRAFAKTLRDEAKKTVNDLTAKYFASKSTQVMAKMSACDRAVKELCRLTIEFAKRFDEIKKERHIIDFSDMEHYALQILVDHPLEKECEGRLATEIIDMCTPSQVALEYRDFYKEVLIDEYQDSNNVQEMILKAISGDDPSLSERFMVGDVKQSIYKFRLARPEIFMEKFESFDKAFDASDRRIDLHKNFRSRKEILDITNYIFHRIMGADLGKVDYDSDAELVYGASYEKPRFDVTPELLLVDGGVFGESEESYSDSSDETDTENSAKGLDDPNSPFADFSSKEREVAVIAARIKELLSENPELSYKDMVILLRSPSGWNEVIKKILSDNGIPAYVESKSGYFTSYEVSVLLNMMSVIDNPRQNIELISVMKSAMFGFTDEELAGIRIAMNKLKDPDAAECYYLAMKEELELGTAIKEKITQFTDLIDEFRTMSTFTPVHELLEQLINRTDFETIVTAMPYGNQRKANIELLLSDASNFEKTSFKGLFHFVRYIEHLKNSQVDYGEAGTIDENADVVRVMSIHKSKGLEFPVVFVAGLGQKLNFKDTTGNLILDMDLGLGVRYINPGLGTRSDTLKRVIISDGMVADSLGEELRVLYVALTRAKEKLIMTAGFKDLAKSLSNRLLRISSIGKAYELLPYTDRSKAKSYLDLVLPAVFIHSAMRPVLERCGLDLEEYDHFCDHPDNEPALMIKAIGEKDLTITKLTGDVEDELRRKALENPACDSVLEEKLRERFLTVYSHPDLAGLFTKTTVTELKKKMLEQEGEFDAAVAEFADESGKDKDRYEDSADIGNEPPALTGAERGTAYHRIMELLDGEIYGDEALVNESLDKVAGKVKNWIDKLTEKEVIPSEYRDCMDTRDVAIFLSTELGKRMGAAFRNNKLMREKPFMMRIPASELDSRFPKDETVLIQGIVDAWFWEGDDIVLMDYKTDRVKSDKELTDRYTIQLDYYKRALQAATGKKVKEVYIYSFALGRQIQVSV